MSVCLLTLGVGAIGLIFWYLQFSTTAICCGDYDGYYHTRWSRLLWEGMRNASFPPAFNWLPLTTLNAQDFHDHHLFFHILQIPFTWFGDLRFGAKLGAWLFAVAGVSACYWLIVRYRIKHPLLWLVALVASSNTFLWRINMTKAMSVSLVLMIVGIYLLFERKYRWLAPLAFLYVWTYSLWVMLGCAAIIWSGVIFWSEVRPEWRPILWTALGAAAGFVINPYFPQNVLLFYEHVAIKATTGNFSTSVGGEWYPFNSWEFLSNCVVAFVMMCAGYITFRGSGEESSRRSLFLLIFSTILLVATARSRRWVEYWAPFAVLFAAFSWQSLLDRRPCAADDDGDDVGGPAVWKKRAAFGVIICALCAAAYLNIRTTAREIAASAAPEEYAAAMSWVRGHVPPGEIIFNTGWDDFPKLFYHNTEHRYVSGLDPTYLLSENRGLAELYDRITLVQEPDAAPLISARFGARYVFTRRNDFYRYAVNNEDFVQVYEDEICAVFHITGS